MGMNAGQMNRRIQFMRAGAVDDGYQIVETFYPYGAPTFAARRDVSDAEKMASGRVLSEVTARFRVRTSIQTRAMRPQDRLICDGKTFNILGIKEADERGTFLEITAVWSRRP